MELWWDYIGFINKIETYIYNPHVKAIIEYEISIRKDMHLFQQHVQHHLQRYIAYQFSDLCNKAYVAWYNDVLWR